jgi:hypothetical protein
MALGGIPEGALDSQRAVQPARRIRAKVRHDEEPRPPDQVGVHDDGCDGDCNDINRGTFNTQIRLKFDRSTKWQSTVN